MDGARADAGATAAIVNALNANFLHLLTFLLDPLVQGGDASPEADVWALGCVLVEIAADGRAPLDALLDAALAELLRGPARIVTRDLLQLPSDTPGT